MMLFEKKCLLLWLSTPVYYYSWFTTVDVVAVAVVVVSGTLFDVVVVSGENSVGFAEGFVDGINVGETDGGFEEGSNVGETDGITLGSLDCTMDGLDVGNALGVVVAISAFVVVVVSLAVSVVVIAVVVSKLVVVAEVVVAALVEVVASVVVPVLSLQEDAQNGPPSNFLGSS